MILPGKVVYVCLIVCPSLSYHICSIRNIKLCIRITLILLPMQVEWNDVRQCWVTSSEDGTMHSVVGEYISTSQHVLFKF